jgi:2-dehydro-3-deoxygluconokinase
VVREPHRIAVAGGVAVASRSVDAQGGSVTPIDVISLGEAMIEFNQAVAAEPRNYLQGFGGDTSNAVIAAARQGARVAYITRLGDDDFGRMLLRLWRDEGVDTSAVGIDSSAPTGLYFVSHGDRGHSFSYRRAGSAASGLQPSDVRPEMLRGARYLHVSGISQAISASATDTVFHAIRLAREAQVAVAYDPNLRLKLWPLPRARAIIRETMALSDYFLPSLEDLRLLAGVEEPAALLDWSHRQGAKTVVLKMGQDGAWVSAHGTRTRIAPHKVNAVDATGAGDCFDGAFLARLAAGDEAAAAARYANAAAALTTTGFGAVDPLPTPPQVIQLLGQACEPARRTP